MSSSWIYVVCSMLGLWLLSSPVSMGYPSETLFLSDLISGAAILFVSLSFGIFKKDYFKWVMAVIGTWLTFAPLVFWAPDAGSYANDTIIGSLIIICSIVVPTILEEKGPLDSGIPPAWSYNPSSWKQRFPIIILAFMGFLMARYLSAFQLSHIKESWDPFFGKGTETVLTSDISKWFPVSDAGLGAWSYLLDALSGAVGGSRRWRSMPWIVVLFGVMVIPPGITSITLVVLQPLAVGSWCTLCLVTAVIMLLMVPPAIDEVVATVQGLMEGRKKNFSLWKMFWFGIPMEASKYRERPESLIPIIPSNLVACTLLGSWVMFAPTLFNAQGVASDGLHLLGALIVTFAIVPMSQVARPLRFMNTIFGGVLAAVVWFLEGGNLFYQVNAAVTGLFLVYFSWGLGKIKDRYGSYDRIIYWVPFHKPAPMRRNLRHLFARH